MTRAGEPHPSDEQHGDTDAGPDPDGTDRNAFPRTHEATTGEEAMAPGVVDLREESAYASGAAPQRPSASAADTGPADRGTAVQRDASGDVSVRDPDGEREVAKANRDLSDPAS